jgi:2-keto-4-pentenoate hydratase/2-oxohepta-3-ene-1,7-dioic acid hydratase in catechol pathway
MKLARFGNPGSEKPALVDTQGRLRDLSERLLDITAESLSGQQLEKIAAIDVDRLPLIDDHVRIGPPVADVRRIICIGLNYKDHAAETHLALPTEPLVFLKGCRPSGPNDDIYLPSGSKKADWEVELAVVIGKRGLYIPEEDSLSYVAGYCTFNDFSEREYQMERGGQWTKGKSFPGFAPMGPWLVTRDEVPFPGDLRLWLEVDGHRYQDGTTKNLIFSVPTIIAYVSRFFELEPGDVIATGTPAGVGLGHKPNPVFLKPGNVIELAVEKLGAQRQLVLAWDH